MNEIAEINVSYSTLNIEMKKITSVAEAYDVLLNSWNQDAIELQEEFKVIYLNRANKVLGVYALSKGTISGTLVDVRLIFAVALKCNASGIILAHNHPSGNLKPSEADKSLTSKIKQCAEFMDINLIDHLIITKNNYYSFITEGIL